SSGLRKAHHVTLVTPQRQRTRPRAGDRTIDHMKRVGIRGVRRSAAVRARSRRLTSPLDWRGWQRLDRLLCVERVLAPPSNKRLVNEGELGKAALANLTGGGTILLRPTSSRTPRCPATFPFIGKSTPVPGPNPPPPVCAPASSPECSRAPAPPGSRRIRRIVM